MPGTTSTTPRQPTARCAIAQMRRWTSREAGGGTLHSSACSAGR